MLNLSKIYISNSLLLPLVFIMFCACNQPSQQSNSNVASENVVNNKKESEKIEQYINNRIKPLTGIKLDSITWVNEKITIDIRTAKFENIDPLVVEQITWYLVQDFRLNLFRFSSLSVRFYQNNTKITDAFESNSDQLILWLAPFKHEEDAAIINEIVKLHVAYPKLNLLGEMNILFGDLLVQAGKVETKSSAGINSLLVLLMYFNNCKTGSSTHYNNLIDNAILESRQKSEKLSQKINGIKELIDKACDFEKNKP